MGINTDRRAYSRVAVTIDCSLFIQGHDDTYGRILDISNNGARAEIFSPINIKCGDKIYAQYMHKLNWNKQSYIITCNLEVVRVVKTENGVEVGCKITNPEAVSSYIDDLKVEQLINRDFILEV